MNLKKTKPNRFFPWHCKTCYRNFHILPTQMHADNKNIWFQSKVPGYTLTLHQNTAPYFSVLKCACDWSMQHHNINIHEYIRFQGRQYPQWFSPQNACTVSLDRPSNQLPSLVSRWWAHCLVFQVTQEKNWALMRGRYMHAKPVLDIVQSRLAKYLWPLHHAPSGYRYSHAFDKSFFGHSTSPSPAVWRSSPKWLKWPKLTTQPIWLAGQLMTSQSRLATVLEETPLTCGKWKRKWHHWLRMRLQFLLNLCRHQNTVRPILVTRIDIKEGDAFQLITKVFNWHGRMDLLCLQ